MLWYECKNTLITQSCPASHSAGQVFGYGTENIRQRQTLVYVEIKCQLDATDVFFYCRSYSLLNMFQAPLCPSSGAREYYTVGCCLWYLVLWFFKLSVWCGAEGYVSGLRAAAATNCMRLRWSRGSVLAFGTQVRGFKPGPKPSDFSGRK